MKAWSDKVKPFLTPAIQLEVSHVTTRSVVCWDWWVAKPTWFANLVLWESLQMWKYLDPLAYLFWCWNCQFWLPHPEIYYIILNKWYNLITWFDYACTWQPVEHHCIMLYYHVWFCTLPFQEFWTLVRGYSDTRRSCIQVVECPLVWMSHHSWSRSL